MSSVDQLFDRFGDLLKTWIRTDAPDERPLAGGEPRRQRSGDPFFDEAMEELDAFLDDDKEAQERAQAGEHAPSLVEFQTTNSP